jgi:hypothetical protein
MFSTGIKLASQKPFEYKNKMISKEILTWFAKVLRTLL